MIPLVRWFLIAEVTGFVALLVGAWPLTIWCVIAGAQVTVQYDSGYRSP